MKERKTYNLKSIGDLFEYRKYCRSQLKKAVYYGDMVCVFYYTRMIDILNVLIKKKGYETNK